MVELRQVIDREVFDLDNITEKVYSELLDGLDVKQPCSLNQKAAEIISLLKPAWEKFGLGISKVELELRTNRETLEATVWSPYFPVIHTGVTYEEHAKPADKKLFGLTDYSGGWDGVIRERKPPRTREEKIRVVFNDLVAREHSEPQEEFERQIMQEATRCIDEGLVKIIPGSRLSLMRQGVSDPKKEITVDIVPQTILEFFPDFIQTEGVYLSEEVNPIKKYSGCLSVLSDMLINSGYLAIKEDEYGASITLPEAKNALESMGSWYKSIGYGKISELAKKKEGYRKEIIGLLRPLLEPALT